jgi:hypothetical protein
MTSGIISGGSIFILFYYLFIYLFSIEQGLMASPNCQAGQGKDGAAQSLGEQWLL